VKLHTGYVQIIGFTVGFDAAPNSQNKRLKRHMAYTKRNSKFDRWLKLKYGEIFV